MSPTPSHLIYSLMQRKQIESSDDEDYYCPESRGGKRLKIEEDESLKRIDSEENLDFQSEREELGTRAARERRHQTVNQRAQRPWSITPSCSRLHTLEEHILELERTELRSETLRNRLEELAENRKELIRKIQDLPQTQLQEQLTNTLARIQNQLRTPRTGLQEATHSRPALDCCQNQISPEDTVEVETPFHKENQFELAKVVQTLENNIVLIRLRSTNKVLGSFGSKLRVLKDI